MQGVKIFRQISIITLVPFDPEFLVPPMHAHTVWPRATKFGIVTHVREWRVFRGQQCLHSRRRGSRLSKFFNPHLHGTVWPRPSKFGMVTCGEGVLQARSYLKGVELQHARIVCMCVFHTVWHTAITFYTVSKLDDPWGKWDEEDFTGSPTLPALAYFCDKCWLVIYLQ